MFQPPKCDHVVHAAGKLPTDSPLDRTTSARQRSDDLVNCARTATSPPDLYRRLLDDVVTLAESG